MPSARTGAARRLSSPAHKCGASLRNETSSSADSATVNVPEISARARKSARSSPSVSFARKTAAR